MVFKMLTLDLTRGLDEDFPPGSTSSSSSSATTLCCTVTLALATSRTIELVRRTNPRGQPPATQYEEEVQLQQGSLSKFTFKELKAATDNFSRENLMGRGGYGKVYKGQLDNGYVAAVKRCIKFSHQKLVQFQGEVKVGNTPNHRNVMPLLGFCATPKSEEYLLVYPFMVNDSVASCLRARTESQPPLSWHMRKKIAVGAARGLRHLQGLNIIHRDIKAANILLDERFEPHIGDFGLAIFVSERNQEQAEGAAESENAAADFTFRNRKTEPAFEHEDLTVITGVRGTIGHIAPEYLSTGHCSIKSDIFSFGVMLLELLTGQRAFKLARLANDDDVMLLDWVKTHLRDKRLDRFMDPDMQGDYNEGEAEQLIKIALLCTQFDPKQRPNASEVVQILTGNGRCERWEAQKDHIIFTEEQQLRLKLERIVNDSGSHLRPEELSGPR